MRALKVQSLPTHLTCYKPLVFSGTWKYLGPRQSRTAWKLQTLADEGYALLGGQYFHCRSLIVQAFLRGGYL